MALLMKNVVPAYVKCPTLNPLSQNKNRSEISNLILASMVQFELTNS